MFSYQKNYNNVASKIPVIQPAGAVEWIKNYIEGTLRSNLVTSGSTSVTTEFPPPPPLVRHKNDDYPDIIEEKMSELVINGNSEDNKDGST